MPERIDRLVHDGDRVVAVRFHIGKRDYDVPVPMALAPLQRAWPFVETVGKPGTSVIDQAAAVCGVVAGGMMLTASPPGQHELACTATADQIDDILGTFAELMKHSGLEMRAPEPGELLATSEVQIGTELLPSSSPTASVAETGTRLDAA